MDGIQHTRATRVRSPGRLAAYLAAVLCAVSWLGVLPGGLGGVGLALAEEEQRFTFVRTAPMLIRIDSRTGQVWIAALDGDGGWKRVGLPAPAEGSERNGRYRVRVISVPSSGPMSLGETPILELIRMDMLSGRTWLADALPGATWSEHQVAPPETPDDA